MWLKVKDWLENFVTCLCGLILGLLIIPFSVIAVISCMLVPDNPLWKANDKFVTQLSTLIVELSEEGD